MKRSVGHGVDIRNMQCNTGNGDHTSVANKAETNGSVEHSTRKTYESYSPFYKEQVDAERRR